MSPNKDPHKCPIIISSTNFDFNLFTSIDATTNICTYAYSNSWFQIEFTRGIAILDGFRLKKCSSNLLKDFKIICTDDNKKSINEWTTLIQIKETKENEHEDLDIYKFSHPSPPIRFVRLIQTSETWGKSLFLQLYYIDLFGIYI